MNKLLIIIAGLFSCTTLIAAAPPKEQVLVVLHIKNASNPTTNAVLLTHGKSTIFANRNKISGLLYPKTVLPGGKAIYAIPARSPGVCGQFRYNVMIKAKGSNQYKASGFVSGFLAWKDCPALQKASPAGILNCPKKLKCSISNDTLTISYRTSK